VQAVADGVPGWREQDVAVVHAYGCLVGIQNRHAVASEDGLRYAVDSLAKRKRVAACKDAQVCTKWRKV
jgi:hypothetical protein